MEVCPFGIRLLQYIVVKYVEFFHIPESFCWNSQTLISVKQF